MSTISKMETPTGQEETAILLEEQARRIATLQESLKQAGCINPNEAVILQEIKRVVEERDDLKRRLENAELLIERLKREVKELDFSVTIMLEALEEVMGELDVEGLPCPLCGRNLTIGHRRNCIWHVVASAVRKARGEE